MKIVVCLKQVPSRDALLKVNSTSTWVEDADVSYEANEPDAYALEEALQLKEKHSGEVIVCSMGSVHTSQAVKEALAKGADRALYLETPDCSSLDARATAQALSAVIRKQNPDLVLTGLQSDDSGFGQTGVILAEILGLPHSTIIMEIQVEGGVLRAKRELEGGWFEWVEMPLPALLTIQSGINKPRYATLKGIMGARNKPLEKLSLDALDLEPGALEPRQKITRVYVPVKTSQTEFIDGSPKEIAARLVDKLKNDARVI